jgi:3-oxoadipate CoA-transferase alpha subunit
MIDKISPSIAHALSGVQDGSTVLIGGFGTAGIPNELIDGLIEQGARELTVVNNNAGNGDSGLAALLKTGRVRKIICSFPRQADSFVFDELYRAGQIELELVPQGNLAERLRAAGAGVGAFFTPTGFGTELALNADGSPKETRVINGKPYVLEYPIHGDVALIKAEAWRPLGQPDLPQGRAQLRPGDGHRRQAHHRQRARDRRTRQPRP